MSTSTRTLKRSLVAVIVVVVAIHTPPARADVGAYLDIADWTPVDEGTVMGPEGVPQVEYSWGTEDNPVTVSQWALQHWSWWLRDASPGDRDVAIQGADWLLAHQRSDGAWTYDFDFNARGVRMTAPWISAMAQGQAMSVFVRAFDATGDRRYIDAATFALGPLQRTFGAGGALAYFDGVPWLEEYPGEDAQHVLNGYEFTLIGLHDLAPFSAAAQQLFDEHAASLAARIGVFDAPAARSQYYAALGKGRVPSVGGYPRYHAVLTRELAQLTGIQTLKDYAARWERYLLWRPAPPRPPAPVPAPAVPAAPPTRDHKRPCRYGNGALRTRGAISCRRARAVMRRYSRRAKVRGWHCHTGRRAICRRGRLRVSAPRP